jgi:hypothetical protein
MGWGAIALGGLKVIELPLNPHAMLVRPFVKHLAAHLATELAAAAPGGNGRNGVSHFSSENSTVPEPAESFRR